MICPIIKFVQFYSGYFPNDPYLHKSLVVLLSVDITYILHVEVGNEGFYSPVHVTELTELRVCNNFAEEEARDNNFAEEVTNILTITIKFISMTTRRD